MKDFIEEYWFPLGLLGMIAACIVALVVLAEKEQASWEEFSLHHSCVIMAEKQGHVEVSTGWAHTSNGGGPVTTTSTTPDQVAWKCSNGVTYWRNK